ncbi:nucleotidyltransferase domain-containing protein [Parvimonas micra]
MSVQSEFKKFNDKIRADFEVKKELSDKRDILLGKLRNNDELPSFKELNQGSYAMCTGIEPEDDSEYDIDVALRFSANKDDYDPIELKEKICEILKNHTDYGAEIKKPCVTVTYKKDGEAKFHVDLVTYLYADKDDENSQLYIAKGKDKDSQEWEEADPKGLVDYINNRIEQCEQREQYRRLVRYLKKWKNRKFSNTGYANPPSIGITLLVVDNFNYYKEDDLSSLINVVDAIINKFSYVGKNDFGRDMYRICLSLPNSLKFKFGNNIFEKMSVAQITDFKDKIEKLKNDLVEVSEEADEQEQYNKLNKIFGDDFEIPEAKNSAKKQFNYIPSSSASGLE